MASQIMDIVIPYTKSKTDELRYCLRSLKNIEHGKVFICGDKPDFISDKVIHIPRSVKGHTPQLDVELNTRLALLDERLSDDFILFNDDFFVIKKVNKLHNYQNGTLKDLLLNKTDYKFMKYRKYISATINYLDNFDNPISFELHVPMVFNKQDRLEISDTILPLLSSGIPLLVRSIYGNIFCDVNEFREDVKVYGKDDMINSKDFVSTYDPSFNGDAGKVICNMFDVKSEYEL